MNTARPALAPVRVAVEHHENMLLIRSRDLLGHYPENFATHLRNWARDTPDAPYLSERGQDLAWQTLTYKQTLHNVRRLSDWMLQSGLLPGDRLLIIQDNSVIHGLLILAAMHIGCVTAAVSAKHLNGHARLEDNLRHFLDVLRPRAIFVEWQKRHINSPVLSQYLAQFKASLVTSDVVQGVIDASPDEANTYQAVEDAFSTVSKSTPARVFFTSGSTGRPKAVLLTHGMLGAQQQQMAQCWKFLESHPPTLVDWLPWTHTSGGINSFNMTLRNGGALYIDRGLPKPKKFGTTLQNLKSVSPTWYTNVPVGYQMLVPQLQSDDELRHSFLRRLDMALYGGASLDAATWTQLKQILSKGGNTVLGCGWGSTETTSTACVVHHANAQNGTIGHPLPGMTLKLEKADKDYSVSVKGPNVVQSYLGSEESILESDGFLPMGDAIGFCVNGKPEAGLQFNGRIAENFKLGTGEWVRASWLRAKLLAAFYPHVSQILLAGPDMTDLCALVWLSASGKKSAIRGRLKEWNAAHLERSQRIASIAFSKTPLSLEEGEITEKGGLNQARCFETRHNELVKMVGR
jgi:feruloyl-CoA synthase